MHLFEVIGENPLGILPGLYLAEDVNAGEMLSFGWGKILRPGSEGIPFSPEVDWNGQKILFVRPGGFGDLLFLTPTFAAIKARWPESQIYVACYDRFQGALVGNPDVAGFVPYPVPLYAWKGFAAQIALENIIENNPDAHAMHAVDVIAKRVGLELEDRAMRYFSSQVEDGTAAREFPKLIEGARIGLQMTASGGCRVYPFMGDLARRLWRDGYEVFLFGRPGDLTTNTPAGIVNLMMMNKSFRESCAILRTCDVVVAPDSALVHVAGALEIPCIGLYGPFPWKLRTAFAPKTFSLQGMCPVSPCFHHSRPGLGAFPANGPCSETGKCEALATITVDRILREVEKRIPDGR